MTSTLYVKRNREEWEKIIESMEWENSVGKSLKENSNSKLSYKK